MEEKTDIDATLTERGKTHGRFGEHANYTQCLKELMRRTKNWENLTVSQAEALEMIAQKIGRVLAGDPNFQDHWIDIAGYATLVVRELEGVNK